MVAPSVVAQSQSENSLLIENGPTHGTGYQDSLGANFNLRYIPITIKNDSSVTARIQIQFDSFYENPKGYEEGIYRVFPLPKEWVVDGMTDDDFDVLWEDFESYVNRPQVSAEIQEGGEFSFVIATLYPLPAEKWWIVPRQLSVGHFKQDLKQCDEITGRDERSQESGLPFVLQLSHDSGCSLLYCGYVNYLSQ